MKTGLKLAVVAAVCSASAALLIQNKASKNEFVNSIKKESLNINARNTQIEKIEDVSSSVQKSNLLNETQSQAYVQVQAQNAGLAKQRVDADSIHMKPLTTPEIQSITNISKALSQVIGQGLNSDKFMSIIRGLGLQPKFIDEGTKALGSMITVRTQNSLEGTRYLHAQFIGEKKNADLVEHVSFQIRPGSDSFEKAVSILNQVLPKNKTMKENGPGFVLYNTEDGYVAWVKVSTSRTDLQTNKYNASSKEDIGSVIVTIEQEIHNMDDDHNH